MKNHKIELTQNQMQRLNLAIGYYMHRANETRNFSMLVECQMFDKIRKMLTRRIFDLQFSQRQSLKCKLPFHQLEIDLVWRCFFPMEELEDLMFEFGQKTQRYNQ